MNLARELRETVKQEGDGDTNCSWCTRKFLKRLQKTRGIGDQRNFRDHLDHRIVKIKWYTLKNLGDLRILAVTPVKNYQVKLRCEKFAKCEINDMECSKLAQRNLRVGMTG